THDHLGAPGLFRVFEGRQPGAAYTTRSPGRTLMVVPEVQRYPLKLSFACVVAGTPVEFPN
ncbi:MAG: hypothetical protein GWN71_35715, partial [Gammaproteobacteria bacterium]|nr:hypothetical protein [Gemmatimonadota bacterium]NIU78710.1 hypothetical protein [Gammaproteobacteria bacterium]